MRRTRQRLIMAAMHRSPGPEETRSQRWLARLSLLLACLMYFRELSPGKAAITGIIAAGVWAQAGGIWGLPQALILTGAHAVGAT